MAATPGGEDDKVAFFALVESLAGGATEAEDRLTAEEAERRGACLGFFGSSSLRIVPRKERPRWLGRRHGAPARKRTGSMPIGTEDKPAAQVMFASSGVAESTEQSMVASTGPLDSPAQVIAATQAASAKARKGRLDARLAARSDDADETVIPDSTRPAIKEHRRSESTPAMMLVNKRLSAGALLEGSPSVGAGQRKRKRVSDTKMQAEEDRIFQGLAFFYVPDNDIAPARRLRIGKAKEYGARWTRSMAAATHVVADKSIGYEDVRKLADMAGLGGALPKLVNEDYPIDCIRFKALLDHDQKKYHVAGQPAKSTEDAQREEPTSTGQSDESLVLKAHVDKKRRGTETTPAQSGEPSQRSVVDAMPAKENPGPVALNEKPGESSDDEDEVRQPKDELSGYIAMMQEFKDLPLDHEDEDTFSESGRTEATSRADDENDDEDPVKEQSPEHEVGARQSRPRLKLGEFKDRFACNHAGEKDAHADNPNARTIQVLQSMADYYERTSDHWRTMSYRKAITTLKRQSTKVRTEAEAARLPHIGTRLAQKIEEIVTTDRLRRLEYAQAEPTDGPLAAFLQIYGVGLRQAQRWIAQGHRTLDDLRRGAKLTPSQRVGVERYDDLATRIPRREVAALGAVVRRAAAMIDPAVEIVIGGSYRRGADSSSDVDLIVTRGGTTSAADLRPFLDALVARLEGDGFLVARLASSRTVGEGSMWHGCCVLPRRCADDDEEEGEEIGVREGAGTDDEQHDDNLVADGTWRRIDFLLVPETEMGGALIYFTGNDLFNRSMRLLARRKGMRLNQRGLWRDVMPAPQAAAARNDRSGTLVEGRDERRIFDILGVCWREPRERWC